MTLTITVNRSINQESGEGTSKFVSEEDKPSTSRNDVNEEEKDSHPLAIFKDL